MRSGIKVEPWQQEGGMDNGLQEQAEIGEAVFPDVALGRSSNAGWSSGGIKQVSLQREPAGEMGEELGSLGRWGAARPALPADPQPSLRAAPRLDRRSASCHTPRPLAVRLTVASGGFFWLGRQVAPTGRRDSCCPALPLVEVPPSADCRDRPGAPAASAAHWCARAAVGTPPSRVRA
jgi:hypothetical protein